MQKIDIVNLALARLGQASIASLSEGSEEAAKASAMWDSALEVVLQSCRWGFNIRRMALALQEKDPKGSTYRFRYAQPADMLQAYEIFDGSPEEGHAIPFVVEDGSVFTDEAGAILIYGVREDRCSRFTPSFRDALAWRLCADLAVSLTQRADLARYAEQMFQNSLSRARALTGNGRRPKRVRMPQYIQARQS